MSLERSSFIPYSRTNWASNRAN